MPKLAIVKPAIVVEGKVPKVAHEVTPGEGHVVSLIMGLPTALDGISPAITVQVVEPERDAPRLLRAAEHLLALNKEIPGVVIVDEHDAVQGVVPRRELERAVLQMRRGEHAALAKGLGLRADYREIPGDPKLPFVYWACPQCGHVDVPPDGHEDDPPGQCKRHDPPVQMERRVHGGG